MNMKVKRSHALVVLLGLGITGVVGVSAASLNGLNADQLGADATVVASCDDDSVDVGFTTSSNGPAGTPAVEVDTVELTNVDEACDGQSIEVELFEGSTSLGAFNGAADASGAASVTVGGVDAELVDGISVVISG
jgi:hypothetical protein